MKTAANETALETIPGFKLSTKTRKCRTFPDVWAAIVGCEGKGSYWRYGQGTQKWSGWERGDAEYACAACARSKAELDALRGDARQARLRELQDAAGVRDYRVQLVRWVDGRPVIVQGAEEVRQIELIALTSYEQRALPKAAGFRWDPARRVWWRLVASSKLAELRAVLRFEVEASEVE